MVPGFAEIMRQVCTELGLADYCPFPACRRRKRCATAQVLCYQILRQDINAMILPELLELAAGAGKGDKDDNDD